MIDEGFWFAVAIRVVLMTAALVHLGLSYRAYFDYHGDARSLRGLVNALAMFGGVLALVGSSPVIRDALPDLAPAMRIVTASGVLIFAVGLIFAVITWRPRP